MIETERRAQSVPTARRDEMTEGLVQTEAERTGMGQTDETPKANQLTVVVNLDCGYQLLVWTPEWDNEGLTSWFRGLTQGAMEKIWDDPRCLPGRMEQIALARSRPPTHVMNVDGKKEISLVEIKEGVPVRNSLLTHNLYSDN